MPKTKLQLIQIVVHLEFIEVGVPSSVISLVWASSMAQTSSLLDVPTRLGLPLNLQDLPVSSRTSYSLVWTSSPDLP